jgi:hypothetical protein
MHPSNQLIQSSYLQSCQKFDAVLQNVTSLLDIKHKSNYCHESSHITCRKASIGISQTYRMLQVSDGGIGNVGCMKWDLQNYYQGIRKKIKDAGTIIFCTTR